MNNKVHDRQELVDNLKYTYSGGVIYHLQEYVKKRFVELDNDGDLMITSRACVTYTFDDEYNFVGFDAMKDYITPMNALTISDINQILTDYKDIMEEFGFTSIKSDIYIMVSAILFNIANDLSAELGLE